MKFPFTKIKMESKGLEFPSFKVKFLCLSEFFIFYFKI